MTTGLDTEALPSRSAETDSPEPVPLLFVGGTGRSGTHVVSKILDRHSNFRKVPNEARFHTDPGGFPDVLAGRTGPDLFIWRLEHYWWRNFEPRRLAFRGLHRYVPKSRLRAASAAFLRRFELEPEAALRQIFFDLLWPLATEEAKSGLIEQSCDTVAQAPTLLRLFPDARFIHVVRDGRDAAASRVAQARWLARPRTIGQGLEWWEARMRRIDAGMRAIPDDQSIAVSLDELIDLRRRDTYRRMRRFLGLRQERKMRGFYRRQVSGGHGNVGRWQRRGSEERKRALDAAYREILDGFQRDGVNGTRMLNRVYEARNGDGS
jgi:sulfotransferase family protein